MTKSVTNTYVDPSPALGLLSAYKQLRPIERQFVDAYLRELEKDALLAGKRVMDFVRSPDYMKHQSARFLRDPVMQNALVRAAVTERINQLTEALEISAYKVLREVGNVAMASMAHYLDWEHDVTFDPTVNLKDCTPEQLAAIQSIEIEEFNGRRKIKFKLHDKLKALDMIMKHMGMYAEDNAQKNAVSPHQVGAITEQTTQTQAAELYAGTLRR